MASVVVDTGVSHPKAPPKGTGSRPSAGGDEAASPFSDLLEGCEAPAVDTDEAAAKAAGVAPVAKAAAENGKTSPMADEPQAVAAAIDLAAETEIPTDLMLIMASADQPAVPPTAQQAPEATGAEAAPEKAPADPDASSADTDVPTVPAVVAIPATVPVPTSAPAIPAASAIPAHDIAAIGPTQPPAAAAAAAAAVETAITAEALPTEAPIDPAAANKAETADGGEQVLPEKKPVDLAATPKTEPKAEAKASAFVPATDTDGLEQQPAGKSPSDPATPAPKAPRADVETQDAKPKAVNAQPSAQALDNSSALLSAPPVTHVSARHAMQPVTPQSDTANAVPIAGLAVEIVAHAQTGKNRFEIRLDPPELGRIEVRIDVDNDGQVTSHLRVDRAETLDLLRREAPALERALQQAGLKTTDNGLQFSLRDQSFSQQHQGRDLPAMARIVVPDDKLAPVETQNHYGRLAGIGSGVDIRV